MNKYVLLCREIEGKLLRVIHFSIRIYLSKSSDLIHLTSDIDLCNCFCRILEEAPLVFDNFSFNSRRNQMLHDKKYYLNYHRINKLYLYQRKGQQRDYLLFNKYH